MAASHSCSPLTCKPSYSISSKYPPFSTFFLLFVLLSFCLLSISPLLLAILKRLKKIEDNNRRSETISLLKRSLSKYSENKQNSHQLKSTQLLNSTQWSQSLLLDVLPASSPKWGALFSSVDSGSHSGHSDGEDEIGSEEKKKKKKRRKGKKKRLSGVDLQLENAGENKENEGLGLANKEELVCLYPFTSSSSATQRKIKQQYDQLVKSHESKGLTLAQVGQFVDCLVGARNELQNKSECIKRKFTITKALLLKADRSSYDRLRQQIYKIELEQKRLEEDAFVYNWLQHQLKLSPAYKKMVEIGASMELKAKSGELTGSPDTEQDNVSFEDFLAQEKKDAFWQNYSKLKQGSG